MWLICGELVGQLGFDELAVEAGNVGDGLVLGTYGFAGTGVGAVTETEFVHLGYHGFGTLGGFYTALGKECELAHL